MVKILRLFGVSHIDVSSDDKHRTVAVKNRCLGSPAQRARMLHYYTGLKLTAQHSINTTKTTTWTPALSYCTTDLFCFSRLLKTFVSLNPINLYTYLLTPWCRVLLEKLTGLQLVKKFPAFYGTRRFINAFTSVHHLSLSWASPIQSHTHIPPPGDPS